MRSDNVRGNFNMRCYLCGGKAEKRPVTYSLQTNRGLVLIEGVPAFVCIQCGEKLFELRVIRTLERIRDKIESGTISPEPARDVGHLAYV